MFSIEGPVTMFADPLMTSQPRELMPMKNFA